MSIDSGLMVPSLTAVGLRSDLRIAADTVLKGSYDEAPVSNLYLYGRPRILPLNSPSATIRAAVITSAFGAAQPPTR